MFIAWSNHTLLYQLTHAYNFRNSYEVLCCLASLAANPLLQCCSRAVTLEKPLVGCHGLLIGQYLPNVEENDERKIVSGVLGNGTQYAASIFRWILQNLASSVTSEVSSEIESDITNTFRRVFAHISEERCRGQMDQQSIQVSVWSQLFSAFEGVPQTNNWQERQLPLGLGPSATKMKRKGTAESSSKCHHCRRCPSCMHCPDQRDKAQNQMHQNVCQYHYHHIDVEHERHFGNVGASPIVGVTENGSIDSWEKLAGDKKMSFSILLPKERRRLLGVTNFFVIMSVRFNRCHGHAFGETCAGNEVWHS